jgi:site-specific DNA-cytosine methylase
MVRVSDQVAELAHQNGLKVTDAIAGSLFPTPTVSDTFTAGLASTQQVEGSLHSVTLAQIVNRADLFPTPNTMDMLPARTPEAKALNKGKGGYSNLRESVVNDLLPTPLVDDSKNDGKNTNRYPTLASVTYQTEVAQAWGRFEPAIRRWEAVIGRPAPSPTNPDGKDGSHRLSPKFAEWLMGLPEGHVTDVGLTRNEQLKACGNGVVPQQAELALRLLVQRLDTNH